MMLLFLSDQMRQQQRALKRTNRDLEKDRHALERQEKQLVRTERDRYSHVTVT